MDQVVDLAVIVEGAVLEGEVVQITISRPLKKHSATSLIKRLPRLMPQDTRDLHLLIVVIGFKVLFMGQIDVLHENIADVRQETSESPPTNAPVVTNPFTVGFAPNSVWKVVECGVFIARN